MHAPIRRKLPQIAIWLCAIMVALAMSAESHANPAEPVDPARLLALLPPAWTGFTAKPFEVGRKTVPSKNSSASMHYRGPGGGAEYIIRLSDEGAYNAKMYRDYGADYLKQDVKNDTQKTLVRNGRRFLLTSLSKNSMGLDTFVADRLVLNLHCINTSEAQCVEALGRIDFAALDKFKP